MKIISWAVILWVVGLLVKEGVDYASDVEASG